MATKFKLFTVEGSGEFPYDMLRYDACWPSESKDAALLGRVAQRRTVRLETCQDDITPDRWRSFGWLVVQDGTP